MTAPGPNLMAHSPQPTAPPSQLITHNSQLPAAWRPPPSPPAILPCPACLRLTLRRAGPYRWRCTWIEYRGLYINAAGALARKTRACGFTCGDPYILDDHGSPTGIFRALIHSKLTTPDQLTRAITQEYTP